MTGNELRTNYLNAQALYEEAKLRHRQNTPTGSLKEIVQHIRALSDAKRKYAEFLRTVQAQGQKGTHTLEELLAQVEFARDILPLARLDPSKSDKVAYLEDIISTNSRSIEAEMAKECP
jgi:type I site-specific restriction endonuclease